MQRFAMHVARLIGIATVAALATLTAPVANAQLGAGPGTPVLVIIDDEDPVALKRSSGIARRVLAELAGAMPRFGLRMVDGESVAGDLGWRMHDRTPRPHLLESLKMMSDSAKAEHFHRAWLLLQLHVNARRGGHYVQVQMRVNGEIYAARDGQLLDAIGLPPAEFPAPRGCLESLACINEVVGNRTQEFANVLAQLLARKLEGYPGLEPSDVRTGSNAEDRTNRYMMTLRNFPDMEAFAIVGVMAEEFPGYRSLELIKKSLGYRTYEYLSTAKPAKLEVWIDILLSDMGLDTTSDVIVTIDGAEIIMEKVSPAAAGDAQGMTKSAPSPEAVEQALSLTHEERMLVQQGLLALGFDAGVADGMFGPRARAAIRAFQKDKGLPETEYLTREQADALMALAGQ